MAFINNLNQPRALPFISRETLDWFVSIFWRASRASSVMRPATGTNSRWQPRND